MPKSLVAFRHTLGVCFCLCFASSLLAQSPASPSDNADAAHESKEPEKPTLKLSGVFEAVNAKEIVVENEQLKSLEVSRIVDHGTQVTKGQNVLWFETEDLDKQLKDAEIELRLAELTMKDDEFAYQQFLESQKLDKAAAERTKKNAQQDYDNFVKVDRERQRLSAEFNIKSSKASLDNAAEELKQLEQMYKEDDLTEESEEIVLKRAKQSVEFAQFRLDGTMITSNRSLEQTIPRSEAAQEDTLARAMSAYQKTVHDLRTAKQRRDIEIAKKRDKFKEQQEKVATMRSERKNVVAKSPIDGVLLYGSLNRGKISDKPSTLKVGSAVAAEQVIATVVDPTKLQVRLDVSEKNIAAIKVGDTCQIKATAYPDAALTGTVKSLASVPYAAGKYDCVVAFSIAKDGPAVMPTMTCELVFEK